MVRLFTAGGMIIDNVVSADGTVQRETLGGNAVYSAAGARLWLDDVGIVALVPANYPVRWLETLREAGIDTNGISVREDAVSCSEWFFYHSDGSRADQLYAEPGTFEAFGNACNRLQPDQAAAFEAHLRTQPVAGLDYAAFRRLHPVRTTDVPAAYRRAIGVHLAPNIPAAQIAMAQELHQPGRRITLDPGSNAAEFSDAVLAALLPVLDAILPSEKELRVMVPGLSNADGLARLRHVGASVAVVKLAAAGAMLIDGTHAAPVTIPILPVDAVDPTGAGDAFCGGFLAGLVATGDPVCAALCGTVSASFAVESFGPFGLLAARHAQVIQRWQTLAQRCALPHADHRLSELQALRPPCP